MFDKSSLRNVLKVYKKILPARRWAYEKYKWQAAKIFQDNWRIEEPDFAGMLAVAMPIKSNLLVASNYLAGPVIRDMAIAEPEKVRMMFQTLFDESLDLWERILSFKQSSSSLLAEHAEIGKNHFQDEHAITTYLWLRYPEKYYIYKLSLVKKNGGTAEKQLYLQKW